MYSVSQAKFDSAYVTGIVLNHILYKNNNSLENS